MDKSTIISIAVAVVVIVLIWMIGSFFGLWSNPPAPPAQ